MKTIKEMKENWDRTTQSADKKPEKYTDKDGKIKIRMVPVKKEETNEKTLTPAEKKKREEIAKAMERDNPGMDMKKKMAIATATAKRVAEGAYLKGSIESRADAHEDQANHHERQAEKAHKDGDRMAASVHKAAARAHMKAASYYDNYLSKPKHLRPEVASGGGSRAAHAATQRANQYNESVKEGTEILEAQDPEMEKVKQLVRLGLMDKKDMTKIVRALTLMKDGKAVPQKERGILFDMLGELIGMITGDDAMFNKARKAVKEEKDMNGMCCKHCGDEFGKPKSESCMYDAYNPEGKNWIKKESYTEADAFGRLGITSPTMKHIDKKLDKVRKRTQTVMNKRPRSTMEEKDPGEYDNEGAMAKTQLKGILTDAEHMIKMFSDDQNLPEWVQNKITKAADYLNTAHRYMMNDDDAQTNEDLASDLRREREKQARNKARTATAKTEIDRNKATDKLHKMGLNRSMDRAKHYDARMKLSGLKKEEVELDEAVGTSAKYADKSGMFGGKYTSKDRLMTMKNMQAIRKKRQDQKDAEHKKQDPKMAKMGYAKHMMDTDKADAKARKRGINPDGQYDKYKKKNNIKDSVQVDEVLDTPQAMRSYKDKAKSGLNRAKNSALASTVRGDKPGFDKAVKKMSNRETGLKRADDKAVNKTFKMLRKEETVSEAGPRHTMTTMRNRFGPSVDSKKFGVYKDHMKKHNLDEPTVRMAHQNPDNPESKKMMKNPKYAKGLELYKASIREEKGEWKTDTGWKKPEPERKDQFGNVIKTKNLAKRLAKMAAKKSAEAPKTESASMRNMQLINKIKKSGVVKTGSMSGKKDATTNNWEKRRPQDRQAAVDSMLGPDHPYNSKNRNKK